MAASPAAHSISTRPGGAHTGDQLGLLDHLGIDKLLVMGFCIGNPLNWNIQKRAPGRIVASVHAQPSGVDPNYPDFFIKNNLAKWAPGLIASRLDFIMEMVNFLHLEIVQHSRSLFLQGRFDTAVFEAFKSLEIEIRNAAKLGTDLIGIKLAARAFDPNNGPLTDMQAEAGEREALRNFNGGCCWKL